MTATQQQVEFISNTLNAYLTSMLHAAWVNDNFLEEQAQCAHIEYNLKALNEFIAHKNVGKLVKALNAQGQRQDILRCIVNAEVGLTPKALCAALIAP